MRWQAFLSGVSIVALSGLPVAAGPFSSLIVFGDSLSDVGNIDYVTPSLFKYPGKYYYQGRFSNGPVWVEGLSAGLGLPPLTRSTAGGNDFAYGGAQTSGTSGLDGFFISDVDEQVTQFLSDRTVDANSLFLVFAGANDLDNGQMNVNVPVNQLATQIGKLIAAGARQFLVPNLPLLGLTPKYNTSAATANQWSALSQGINTALEAMLDNLEAGNPSLSIHRLDVASLIGQAVAHPAAFGLTNVSQSAAPGLEPGTSSYNTNLIAAQPNEYLFWDNLHPTAAVHSILAAQTVDLLLKLPGDYNGDGTVNAADYTVWRNTLASVGPGPAADGDRDGIVDRDDYRIWKGHFGEAGGSGALAWPKSVPEQDAAVYAIYAVLFGVVHLRCRVHAPMR